MHAVLTGLIAQVKLKTSTVIGQKWQRSVVSKYQSIKVSNYQIIKLSNYQIIKLSNYQIIKLSNYQIIRRILMGYVIETAYLL